MTSTSKTEVPMKVKAFQEAEDRVRDFKKAHAKVFKEFQLLLEDYNQKLEDAEVEARAFGESVGPFTTVGFQTRIDADRLLEELGEADFAKVGGQMEVRRVLVVDKVRFETYAQSGMIPQDVLDVCYEKKPKFKTPKRADLP